MFTPKVVYAFKAHYGYLMPDENGEFTKMNFVHRKTTDQKEYPLFRIFIQILQGDENPRIEDLEYEESHLASVREFRDAHTKEEVETNQIKFRPGERITHHTQAKFNNTHFPIQNVEEFQTRKRRVQRKNGTAFEIYSTVKEMIQAMERDDLQTGRKKLQQQLEQLKSNRVIEFQIIDIQAEIET